MPSGPTMRRVRQFRGLSGRRRLLIMEAVICLAGSRLAVVIFPFRLVAARLGALSAPGAATADPTALTQTQIRDARDIGWAVTRAARDVPFRAVCLQQAIAAKMMLKRRGIVGILHFGVAKNAGAPLSAHAWLDVTDIQVTGFPVATTFVETARFI